MGAGTRTRRASHASRSANTSRAAEAPSLNASGSDLEENFFPDMKAGGPCMEGLSPAAKARLFDRRMKWLLPSKEGNDE